VVAAIGNKIGNGCIPYIAQVVLRRDKREREKKKIVLLNVLTKIGENS
jgi:hypothetical protein